MLRWKSKRALKGGFPARVGDNVAPELLETDKIGSNPRVEKQCD
jgi:hypothetical protein